MPAGRVRTTGSVLLGVIAAALCGQTFRERVDVELVRLDLLATDSQGRPVPGLRSEEIQVKVDGRTVKIESFEAQLPATGTLQPGSNLPEMPLATATLAPDQAPLAPATPRQRYYMAILSDETSSEQSNRQVALGQFLDFLKAGLPADVEVLLMRFGGTLRIECPWTSDVERLRRGATALAQRRAAALLGTPGQLSNNPEKGQTAIALEAMDAVSHVRSSLQGVFDALRVFPEAPGRKALFVVTDGAPFLTPTEIVRDLIKSSNSGITSNDGPDAARRAQLEADRDSYLLADSLAWDKSRSVSLLGDVARLALARGIAIHPVRATAHDLDGRVRTDREFNQNARAQGTRPLAASSLRGTDTVPSTDIAAGQGMEEMAEITGGDAVLSRRAIRDGLQREVDGRNAAYAIVFRDPFTGDHRFHRIEVSSTRARTGLRYRRGYRVLSVREALIQGAVNRLHAPADANPLGVRLQIESLAGAGERAVARVTVAYPAPPEAGGQASSGSVQIIGICAIRDGAISEPIDLSGEAEQVTFGADLWRVRAGEAKLKPGAYRWSFAVRDVQTGITSYLTFDQNLP